MTKKCADCAELAKRVEKIEALQAADPRTQTILYHLADDARRAHAHLVARGGAAALSSLDDVSLQKLFPWHGTQALADLLEGVTDERVLQHAKRNANFNAAIETLALRAAERANALPEVFLLTQARPGTLLRGQRFAATDCEVETLRHEGYIPGGKRTWDGSSATTYLDLMSFDNDRRSYHCSAELLALLEKYDPDLAREIANGTILKTPADLQARRDEWFRRRHVAAAEAEAAAEAAKPKRRAQ